MKIILFILLFTINLLGKTNSLVDSQSPYLLQHSHNPVNWYPYSEKTLELAKIENKLIFLSIGYSTCHWCHVMEKESFEDESIAKLLNKNYISIKVDKEEMPQIDTFYQHIHSKLKKGRNGWPLTIILTPNQNVLYIATYVPPKDDYGIDGMHKILPKYANLYHRDNEKTKELLKINKKLIDKQTVTKTIDDNNLSNLFVSKMKKRYDKIYKGFDKRPKFPLASHLNALLQIYLLEDNKKAFKMVKESLDAMAYGGIYDQIEGGFFRYSVHPDWVIPHFEKMLYTNAELIPLYTKMYQLTNNPLYKKIVKQSINEMIEKFQDNDLFFSASDADSKDGEGQYFVYDYSKLIKKFKEEDLEYFDITEFGNFKDRLSHVQLNTGLDNKPKRAKEIKQYLLNERKKREFPFVDKKIITSWNAMMIKALFEASKIDQTYEKQAIKSLDSLLEKLYINGTLYHQIIGNKIPIKPALLEDYAFLIDTLITAYQRTLKSNYLTLATKLTNESISKFYKNNKWYLSDEKLKVLAKYNDKYYTAPLSRHFHNFLNLANLNYDLKMLKDGKNYILQEKKNIQQNFDKSPEALMALIRLKYPTITLKSSKKNLSNSKAKIDKIHYPFLLRKWDKTDIFLLCNEQSCFAYDKNITKILGKIH